MQLAPLSELDRPSRQLYAMLSQNILIWNVRRMNMRARRSVIREFLIQERATVLCLVETKVDVLTTAMVNELMGVAFDYVCLPFVGTSGGVIVAWNRDEWIVA